ncbi:MAG: TonB-dependent receptor [Sphingomicrobium sp.]
MTSASSVRASLCAGASLIGVLAQPALAQDVAPPTAPAPAVSATPGEQAASAANTATATSPADADTGAIVVTARRRAESLKDVPIAVTAFTGAQLEKSGAIDITDIAQSTPNVTLETSRGTNSTLTAFIRGVGQQDPVAGFEQGVGLYIDDVYLNRPQAAVLDIYDVERIEVLRGPQGTLYGRNTIGGAIKYVTRRLSTKPELSLRGDVGEYGQLDAVVTGSLPLSDFFRVGASVARLYRGGFGRNVTTGQDNYNKDVKAARVSAEIGRDDHALLRLSADYTRDDSNPRGGHRLIPGLLSGAPVLGNVYTSQGGLLDPKQKVVSKGAAANAQFEVMDGLTLKSITSYRKDDSATPIDFDALPAADVDVPAVYRNKQFSQELQLQINRGPLQGLLGAYYLNAKAFTAFDVRLYNTVRAVPTLPGLTALTQGDVGTKVWAVFGDFTYNISPQLAVSLGGRYTDDRRHSTILRQNLIRGGSPLFGGAFGFGNGTVIATTSSFDGRRKDTAFTPRASISFKPDSNNTFYASYAQGFKGGGFDPRGVSTTAPDTDRNGVRSYQEIYDFLTFRPEKVTTEEVGYKASLFGHRVYTALALFNSDYKDVQIPGSAGAVVGGVQTFIGITTNAAKARIRGVEWEGDARLFGNPGGDRVNLGWSVGYLDGKYRKFLTVVSYGAPGAPNAGQPLNPPIQADVARYRKIQNTPKWNASGTLSFTHPFGNGEELNASTTLSYRSKSQQFELAVPSLDQPAYALLDANLVYTGPDKHWTFGVHARNLTDKRYIVSGYNFLRQNPFTGQFILPTGSPGRSSTLGTEGILTGYYGNPRQIFVTVGYKF